MHEFSVITAIVDLVKGEMEKRDNLKEVKEVVVEVGELSFLSHDALQFGFKALVESEPKINLDALKLILVAAKIKCRKCDYEGPLEIEDSEQYHISLPRFACPKCNGQIDVLEGKECVVRNLVLDLEDD